MHVNWVAQIYTLALSSVIQTVLGFNEASKPPMAEQNLERNFLETDQASIRPSDAHPVGSIGRVNLALDLERKGSKIIDPDSQLQLLGKTRKHHELDDAGLDLGLSLSPHGKEIVTSAYQRKAPRIYSRGSRRIAARVSEILAEINAWEKELLTLTVNETEKPRMQAHVEVVTRSIKNMFRGETSEGNEYRDALEYQRSEDSSPGHLSNRKILNSETKWLASVAEVDQIWDMSKSPNVFKARMIIYRWFDLMMSVFVDLQKHEIIPNCCLSHFLNEQNQGRFILSYLKSRFYPFGIRAAAAYVNFDQKLSLLEDPAMKSMNAIFMSLQQETWEKIEFQYVQLNFERYQLLPPGPPAEEFVRIYQSFLKLELNSETQTLLMNRVESFFTDLTTYISFQIMSKQVQATDRKLLELKILYDILKLVLRNHEHQLSKKFMDDFMETEIFYKTRIFEETIGVLSSMFHSIYVKSKELINLINRNNRVGQPIPHRVMEICENIRYMSDSNENREISNFDKTKMEKNVMDRAPQLQLIKKWKPEVQPYISRNPDIRSENIEKSINKTRLQYERYLLQAATLPYYHHETNGDLTHDFIPFLSKGLCEMVFKKAKQIDSKISQEMLKYTDSIIHNN